MPNIKSVKKDVIKSRKNHQRNISAKSAMKTFIKKARVVTDFSAKATQEAAVAGTLNLDASREAVRLACKAIDKTAERAIIHKNQAARRKSRLMKRLHKLTQLPTSAA